MKFKSFTLSILSIYLTSCSLESNDFAASDTVETTVVEWHLTNVSGGIPNVDINFDLDKIIWIFDVDINGSGTLLVQNHNEENSIEDGLESGEYAVFVAEYDEQPILFLNGEEYAGFSYPTSDTLVINHNITSRGLIASEEYIFTFRRRLIE